jgi:TonB family protein
MQGLIQLSGHPLIYALGWTLLHFCWQGAAVALMLGCVLGLLGGRSSQARYGAACLALALMVVLPAATFAHIASAEYKARTAILGSGVVLDAGMVLQVGIDEPLPPWSTRIGMALDRSLPWILLAWFAGVMVFAGRLNFGLLTARRLKTAGTAPPPATLLRLFDQLRIRLGVQRAVELLHSAQVQVPTVIGWLRPVVLLPVSCLTGLSPDQIEAVLCHELAHVRRHDYLVSVIQSVIETILFYHPAVWWVSKQVRRERECCCDELAVEVGGDVLAYARALSYLEEHRAAFPEFVLGANGGVLKMRIQRILGSKRDVEGSPVAALVALAMILAVAGSYFAAVSHAQAQASRAIANSALPAGSVSVSQEGTANSGGPTAQPLHGIYKAWLEEDVRWIITDNEAQQFKQLANDAERDQFIEQFWVRRNPPGAAAGTFREEHYARIAYSNEHFASDNRVGWRTDRGRIYIVYGKPDSIDSHPSGDGATSYPYEVWHYKYIAGIGDNPDVRFVDTCKCGQYNLTIDRLGQPATGPGAENPQAGVTLASRLLAPGGAGSRVQVAQVVSAGSQPVTDERHDFTYLPPGIIEKDGTRVGPPTGVSGTIVDLHGAAVVSAKMTAINTDTGAKTVTQTDDKGRYSFAALPPGPYLVQMEAKGFSNLPQEKIQLEQGQWLGMNLMFSVAAAAQAPAAGTAQEAGSISGRIVDPTGALVPRAKVTATNTDDGVQTSRVTDNSGTYSIAPLPPGPYNLEVQASGFQRLLQENIQVKVGQTVGLNLKLTVGAAAQTLTVTGRPIIATLPPLPLAEAAKPIGPQRISSGVMQGLAISQPQPVYPEEAKAQHIQGVVVLHARISKEGTVKDLQLISGPPELVVSAIDAVRQWKYKPYTVDGEPTDVHTTININFTLGGDDNKGASPSGPEGLMNVPPPVMEGNLIYKVAPVYPEIAKAAHVQGIVVLFALISKTGDVEDLKVLSGPPMLTSSAIDAVRQWKYTPYMASGVTMEVRTAISVNFSLSDAAAPPKRGATNEYHGAPYEYDGIPVAKIGDGVTSPVVIHKVDPEFSVEARKAKFMGLVLVNLVVDTKGKPQNVHVLRGVGMGLDENAVKAVRAYKFRPATEDGKPVPVALNVEVNFRIF